MSKQLFSVALAAMTALLSAPLPADEDTAKLEALQRQLESLQARVEALEARFTFTSFMPDFAERFHVMHRAGDAGDWAVASHELAEMKRLTKLAPAIDMEKGELMQRMMKPNFEALESAIGHGNEERFAKALRQTTATCNACHTATGSGFVQVTLDASESVSMRHPHKLVAQPVPGGHTH